MAEMTVTMILFRKRTDTEQKCFGTYYVTNNSHKISARNQEKHMLKMMTHNDE